MSLERPVKGMVLGRETVSVDNRPLDLPDLPDIFQTAKGVFVLHQLIIGQVALPEIFPPGGLILPTVVFEHLSKQPQSSLFRIPIRFIGEQARCKALH